MVASNNLWMISLSDWYPILTELSSGGNLYELRNYRKNDDLPHVSHTHFPAAAKPANGDLYACAALGVEGAVVFGTWFFNCGLQSPQFFISRKSSNGRTPDFESGNGGSNPPFLALDHHIQLGSRLTVGHLTLNQTMEVRALPSQP